MSESSQGSSVSSVELQKLMDHLFNPEDPTRAMPLCLWGHHGIGKTEMIKGYAKSKGWQFKYIAPAQLEEMGDLHGLPTIEKNELGKSKTCFASPDWVPETEGPGILLLDDLNRADDRILRGLMQLLQNRELFSWKLPAKWFMVATANPDNSEYSVTTMDDAMQTRMMHFTLDFDLKSWSYWADKAGVDSRGIGFVNSYPEIAVGKKTTPRTLVGLFKQLAPISDWKANLKLVMSIAESLLDENTLAPFLNYIKSELEHFMGPDDLLSAEDFSTVRKKIGVLLTGTGNAQRLDRLSLLLDRTINYLSTKGFRFSELNRRNILSFMEEDSVPEDLRNRFRLELAKIQNLEIRKLVTTPTFTDQLLASL